MAHLPPLIRAARLLPAATLRYRAARALPAAAALLIFAGCGSATDPIGTAAARPVVTTPAEGSPHPTAPLPAPVPSAARPLRPPAARSTAPTAAPTSPGATSPGVTLVGADTHGPAGSLRTTGSTAVALTFDDGPDPVGTPRLLALLRQYHVKATFCMIGVRVRAYPDLVRQIAAGGHTLCDHSWRHRLDLGREPAAAIRADLAATLDAIHKAAPGVPVRYFRAPGGNFTPRLVQVARQLGMTSLYWQVDPRDWDATRYGTGTTMVNHIIATVQAYVRPGSIVLSHDLSRPTTVTACRTLLPWLSHRFRLIALPT